MPARSIKWLWILALPLATACDGEEGASDAGAGASTGAGANSGTGASSGAGAGGGAAPNVRGTVSVPAYTPTKSVIVNMTDESGDVAEMKLSQSADCTGGAYEVFVSITEFELVAADAPGGDGPKDVSVTFKNGMNAESDCYSTTTILDRVVPTNVTITPGDQQYNGDVEVSFTGGDDANLKEYRYTIDGADPTCTTGTAVAPGTTVNVPDDGGDHTVRAIACDELGQSSPSVASATYTYALCSLANLTNTLDMIGSGTMSDPFVICTAAQLQQIGAGDLGGGAASLTLAAYYELAGDVDASDTNGVTPWDATGFVPIGTSGQPFTGTFDGKGYTITGLYINRPGTPLQGLLGATTGATIQNVELVSVNITGGNSTGALIGLMSSGTVASATVSGTLATGDAGGCLVGAAAGTVSRTSASCTISGSGNFIGGLVGTLSGPGLVEDSYATGNVSGVNYVGGLIGNLFKDGATSSVEFRRSYATSNVSGSDWCSNLVGFINDGGTGGAGGYNSFGTGNIACGSNSYWGAAIASGSVAQLNYFSGATCSGTCNAINATPVSPVTDFYSKSQAVYVNAPYPWDFVTVWNESAGGFPTLK